jgi:hypothetical protein
LVKITRQKGNAVNLRGVEEVKQKNGTQITRIKLIYADLIREDQPNPRHQRSIKG